MTLAIVVSSWPFSTLWQWFNLGFLCSLQLLQLCCCFTDYRALLGFHLLRSKLQLRKWWWRWIHGNRHGGWRRRVSNPVLNIVSLDSFSLDLIYIWQNSGIVHYSMHNIHNNWCFIMSFLGSYLSWFHVDLKKMITLCSIQLYAFIFLALNSPKIAAEWL